MDKIMEWIGKIPTTNLRILVTLLLITGTAFRYWANGGWEPGVEWLAFLAAMSGMDVAQHYGKRLTSWQPNEPVVTVAPVEENEEEEIG